jgi:2'-5' RNA ligase
MCNKIQTHYEAALTILVPEAEALVGSYREKYDPSAGKGMPAHITINYPFNAFDPNKLDIMDELNHLLSNYPAFDFFLTKVGHFPGTLYLDPEPAKPFGQLIQAVAESFPDSPPYGGVFTEIVPHLTVAQEEDEDHFKQIHEDFSISSKGHLPIKACASQVWLVETQEDRWVKRSSFELSG